MSDKNKQLEQLIAAHKVDIGVEPDNDLWPGIDQRIKSEQLTTPSTRYKWAVTGFSAMVAGVMAIAVIIGLQTSTDRPTANDDWYWLAQQMNQAQGQQVQGLRAGYEMSGYEPASVGYQSELAQLRQAKEQLIISMQNSGGNAQMIDMLRWINEQELQLIKRTYQHRQQTLQEI